MERPYILLAWDGTGDFGPETPGTQTAGWQEALDSCVAAKRDLYVKGGWGGRDAIYHVSETIRIPPTQDFRIDGGMYVVNWTGPSDRDMIVVDSGMDCHFTFGILVYGGMGAALRVRPENPVPIDGFSVFIDSEISASSIADPQPFVSGRRDGGAGVVFDTEHASIAHADFSFTAVLNFATCIVTPDSGHGFSLNKVACGHLHTNADSSTLLRVGERSVQNAFDVRIGVDQGAEGVTGVALAGANNSLTVTTRGGGFTDGRHVLIDETASGNRIDLTPPPSDAFEPERYVTDDGSSATNRLTWVGAPAVARRVRPIRDGDEWGYVQRLFAANVTVVGAVDGVTLRRGGVNVPVGAGVLLDVGDELRIASDAVPELVVMPLPGR